MINPQLRGTVFLVEDATEAYRASIGAIDYEARVFTLEACETPEEFRSRVRAQLINKDTTWRLEFGPIGAPWGTAAGDGHR